MSDREYRAVDEMIAEQKDWSAYASIVNVPAPQRIEVFEAMLEVAAKRHDAAAGEKFASWLFQAISDAAYAPRLKEERGKKFLSLPYLAETDLRVQVRQAKAEKAMALWPKFPALRSEEDRRYSDRGPYRYPTLVAAKKVILLEAAKHWSETGDEAEADRIFDFFLGIETEFEEDRKMVQEVVREVTNHTDLARLMRHALRAPSHRRSSSSENEFKRAMLVGWARRVTFEVADLQVGVLQLLNGATVACYDLVRNFASDAARLDEAGSALKRVLGDQTGFFEKPLEGYEKIPGQLVICYPDTRSIDARLLIPYYGYGQKQFEESYGHDWFEAAKRNVLRWQETYPYPVTLTVMMMSEGRTRSAKVLFSRSQQLALAARAATA